MKGYIPGLFLIFQLLIAGSGFSQVIFQKTYGESGNDYGTCVQQTSDNGFILVGYSPSVSTGDDDVFLIKTDSNGDTLWTKTFGGAGYDKGFSVKQTPDSGFIVVGSTTSFGAGSSDVYLIKTNANGNILWSRTYGGSNDDSGNEIQITNDNGFIICGTTNSFGSGNSDVYLIKTNATGDTLWTKTYGGIDLDNGISVVQTTDSGYVFCGNTFSFGVGSSDFYVVKTDTTGNVVWSKTYGFLYNDTATSIIQTSTNHYLITGTHASSLGAKNAYLIKADNLGNLIWNKSYALGGHGYWEDVMELSNGNYIIGGSSNGFINDDAVIMKTDTSGAEFWGRKYGGTNEIGLSIQQTNDSGFVLLGNTHLGSGGVDLYLIKTDSIGNSGCNEVWFNNVFPGGPPIQSTQPFTIVTFPGTVVTSPNTVVNSGGIVTILCTSLNDLEPNGENSFQIFPNPSAGNFIISLNEPLMNGTLEIINAVGEIVYSGNIFNAVEVKIDLENNNSGIYFVKIFDGKNSISGKIILKD